MGLLQMSLQGTAMILAVVVVRALFLNKLPKSVFMVLWALVLVRLLVPISIPVPFNAWSAVEGALESAGIEISFVDDFAAQPAMEPVAEVSKAPISGSVADDGLPVEAADGAAGISVPVPSSSEAAASASVLPAASSSSPDSSQTTAAPTRMLDVLAAEVARHDLRLAVALAGCAVCAAVFAVLYVRGIRRFAESLPVSHPFARRWLQAHRLRRPLAIRELDCIDSPMTYGIVKPVILVPKGFNWDDSVRATLVLEHEFVHIARFDMVSKMLLTAAVCLHWFNPLVWVMYILANRDIELACDERVVRRLTMKGKVAYAQAMIDLLEDRAALIPATSAFARNAIEERMVAIASRQAPTMLAIVFSAALVVVVPAAFGTTAESLVLGGSGASHVDDRVSGDVTVPALTDAAAELHFGVLPSVEEGPQEVRIAGATILATPYYSVALFDHLVGDGFSWSYNPEEIPAVYAGREVTISKALTVNLGYGAYPGQSFTVYCCTFEDGELPSFDGGAEALFPGRVEWPCGMSCFDEHTVIGIGANLETAAQFDAGYGRLAYGEPTREALALWASLVSPEATYPLAAYEGDGVRISCSAYSVFVRAEELPDTWSWTYNAREMGFGAHTLSLFTSDEARLFNAATARYGTADNMFAERVGC